MNENYKPWGSTQYGPIKIPIFVAPRKELDCLAYTSWHHGVAYICLADDVVAKPALLDRTLLHEFTHVIENLNDHGWLSPAPIDEGECTALAQCIEEGMSQLLKNLKQVGTGAPKGSASKRRSASGKKARTSRR